MQFSLLDLTMNDRPTCEGMNFTHIT